MKARVLTVSGKEKIIKFKEYESLEIDAPFIFIKDEKSISHIINLAECQIISFEE